MTADKKHEVSQKGVSESETSTDLDQSTPGTQETDLTVLREQPFSKRIDEFKDLISKSWQAAFLIGAGCSKCAGLPLMDELTNKVFEKLVNEKRTHAIIETLKKNFSNSSKCTVEDYMSELVDYITIIKRRETRSGNVEDILIGKNGESKYSLEELDEALVKVKSVIAEVIGGKGTKILVHQKFVRAIHQKLPAGKEGVSSDANYYILNYDTLFEDALSLERIRLADGFSGGVTSWWDPRVYQDKLARAKIFKLHGSIDWCFLGDDFLPSRTRKELNVGDIQRPVLIWPTSEKYREAQRDPFAIMMDKMRRNLRPATSTETVLTICGYSFSDEHINGELDQALHESDGRLTIVVFTSENEPKGQLKDWRNDKDVCKQVRIHAKCGFFHGDVEEKSNADLPWWRFEALTRLLGGER